MREFTVDVLLTAPEEGAKIRAIKAMREGTGIGLKEAKDIVEAAADSRAQSAVLRVSAETYGRLSAAFWMAQAEQARINEVFPGGVYIRQVIVEPRVTGTFFDLTRP